MTDGKHDWKQQALADFARWLDGLGPEPPDEGDPPGRDCDLRDLFAEFAALRQEVRLRNREHARATRELAKATALYESVGRREQHREEDLAAFETRVARTAEDRCLVPFLEVRDALERGLAATARLHAKRRLFGGPPPGSAAVVEGYRLAVRRFDRALSRFGVQPLSSVGHPFDSHTMHAVEMRQVDGVGDGIVVEELLCGFIREGDVLRVAEVAVNRRLLVGPESVSNGNE